MAQGRPPAGDFNHWARIEEDYQALLRLLPSDIRVRLAEVIHDTEEVKLRYGRDLKIKHHGLWQTYPLTITQTHLTDLRSRLDHIRDDNRTGIDGTGHRISRLPGADGKGTDGFTIRVARFYTGIAEVLRPRLHQDPSMLIIGKAGKGKSTLLRDVTRIIAEKYDANTSVVDTSNEIAGDGRIPHPGIGEADRYFVPIKARQHEVLLEVIANNSAHIVILDEVQTGLEADTIAHLHAKAQFVATTHGDDLPEVITNGPLHSLFWPRPMFRWALVVRELGVYDLYDLVQAVQAVEVGAAPVCLESFCARIEARGGPRPPVSPPPQDGWN